MAPSSGTGLAWPVLFLFAGLARHTTLAFPSYQDPITSEPPLDRPPSSLLCTQVLLTNASFRTYTATAYAPYMPPDPSGCGGWGAPGRVGKVVLDFNARVGGVQYDRYGALFLGGVELLRFTTPEPVNSQKSPTHWHVEKDLTDYLTLFRRPSTLGLTLPNPVDKTYTGVIYVDVTVSFYAAGPGLRQQQDPGSLPCLVISLTQPPIASPDEPSAAMQVRGSESLNRTLALPAGRSYLALHLDLYASPHGCEEFYWSNAPDDHASSHENECGGGNYRELQVHIDGQVAGTTYPFPVLYTGGVAPPLWRPLTGIFSLNIPAYRFDLSPFLGLLNDGQPHTYGLSVLGCNAKGFWLLDGVLLGYEAKGLPPGFSLRGGVEVEDSGVMVQRNLSWSLGEDLFSSVINAGRTYSARGMVTLPDGKQRVSVVEMRMSMHNRNAAEGNAVGITSQNVWLERMSRVEEGGGRLVISRTDTEHYPLSVYNSFANESESFQVDARIRNAYERTTTWLAPNCPTHHNEQLDDYCPDASFSLSWSNEISTQASFNTTHKRGARPTIMTGSATESFDLYYASADDGDDESPCYARTIEASEGWVRSDSNPEVAGAGGQPVSCPLPYGLSFCGSNVCGSPSLVNGATDNTAAAKVVSSRR